jgi:hypothetical protein
MNFKKPKQEVIDDATNEASYVISSAFQGIRNGYMNNGAQSNIESMERAIIQGIRMAVTSLVMNTYTDLEFEEDIQLRSKG